MAAPDSDRKVWFITGAGRGMGVDIAQAALAAGHAVVATGRSAEAVAEAVGEDDDLLVVELDITSPASAEAAVQPALDRFGRIDVLVNNAGNFFAGFFEELSPEQFEQQLETNLGGPLNVSRAVLPVMRKQRVGHIITISSTAGIQDRLLLGLCRVEVRSRRVDGVAAVRDRAVRDPHHDRRAGLLPHRPAHEGVNRLRRAVDRRLRRAHRRDSPRLGSDERQANERSRQARDEHSSRSPPGRRHRCGSSPAPTPSRPSSRRRTSSSRKSTPTASLSSSLAVDES